MFPLQTRQSLSCILIMAQNAYCYKDYVLKLKFCFIVYAYSLIYTSCAKNINQKKAWCYAPCRCSSNVGYMSPYFLVISFSSSTHSLSGISLFVSFARIAFLATSRSKIRAISSCLSIILPFSPNSLPRFISD